MSATDRNLVRTLSNKPSFKIRRDPIDRADSLQLLSNIEPGELGCVRHQVAPPSAHACKRTLHVQSCIMHVFVPAMPEVRYQVSCIR
jgi:hypothetical protein